MIFAPLTFRKRLCSHSTTRCPNSVTQDSGTNCYPCLGSVRKKMSNKQLAILVIQTSLLVCCATNEASAQTVSPEKTASLQKLIANTKEFGELQRKFEELGAAKVATIKSKEDVENRIAALDELIKVTNKQVKLTKESGGNAQDLQVLENLRGMQEKTREQLIFFKNNYGKWKISEGGEAEYSVPKDELDKFAECLSAYNAIRINQMELLQSRAEARKKAKKDTSD